MTARRFRMDNTEGYDANDLLKLNAAWDEIVAAAATCDSPPLPIEEYGDYWAEQILYNYDQCNSLTNWFYTTGGV